MRARVPIFLLAALVGVVMAAAQPPTPLGPDFRLNDEMACFASEPQLALFADRELWIWGQEGSIVAGVLDPGGSAVESLLEMGGGAFSPRVDQAADGSGWAAWIGGASTLWIRPLGMGTAPLPLMALEKVGLSVRPKERVPLLTMALVPALPVVPELPRRRVPALIVTPPLKVSVRSGSRKPPVYSVARLYCSSPLPVRPIPCVSVADAFNR